jgi:hypothetical protein
MTGEHRSPGQAPVSATHPGRASGAGRIVTGEEAKTTGAAVCAASQPRRWIKFALVSGDGDT